MTASRDSVRIRCPHCGMVGRGHKSHLTRETECPKCHARTCFVAVEDNDGAATADAQDGHAQVPAAQPTRTKPRRRASAARQRPRRRPVSGRMSRRRGIAMLVIAVIVLAGAGGYLAVARPLTGLDTALHRSTGEPPVTGQRDVLILERSTDRPDQVQYRRSPDRDYPEVGRLRYTVEWRLLSHGPLSSPRALYRIEVKGAYTLTIENTLSLPLSGRLCSLAKVLAPHWTDRLRGEKYRRALASFASYVPLGDQQGFVVPAQARVTRQGAFEFDAPDLAAVNRIADLRFDLEIQSDQPMSDLILDGATMQPLR